MSRRNTRQGKASRRAERERRRSVTSGQGSLAVEVQAAQAAPRPDDAAPGNLDEAGYGVLLDGDGGLITAEPGEADLDTGADPGDFDGLDPDDADLQATLTVLAVLADDISEAAEAGGDLADDLADDLAGDLASDLASDLAEDVLVEEVSIDGMCGVY
jgi:mycofactocin precursor